MLGTSDALSMSRSSHRPSHPPYYIEDCQILKMGAIYNGNLIEVLSKSVPKQPIMSNMQKVSQAKNCKIVNF